jgi:hypothetical protein
MKFKLFNKPTKIIVLLSLMVVFGGVLSVIVIHESRLPTDVCLKSNNIYIIKQASIIIPNEKPSSKLASLASKIKNIKGYNKDPNCLYVLFRNSEYFGNLIQAQSYLTLLKKYYNPKTGLSKYFGYYDSPSGLQAQLNLYKAGRSFPIINIPNIGRNPTIK